jgi:hypothetical protein
VWEIRRDAELPLTAYKCEIETQSDDRTSLSFSRNHNSMTTSLDALKATGTVVVSDSGDFTRTFAF